jgi:hypothetical protein
MMPRQWTCPAQPDELSSVSAHWRKNRFLNAETPAFLKMPRFFFGRIVTAESIGDRVRRGHSQLRRDNFFERIFL